MSAASGTDGGVAGSGPISKWQLALIVGAPVALGLGYMYYRNNARASTKSDRPGKPRNATAKENGTSSANKQISIDGGDVDDQLNQKVPSLVAKQPETPLEEAKRYKRNGNVHFKTGKYDKAIAEYNKAIEICPKENVEEIATFYQNRAAAYEQLKKYDAVKVDCTKAIELNPKYTKAMLRRARVLEQLGDLEAAFEDVTAACIYENFTNYMSLQLADRLLKQLGKQHVQENLANKKFIMPSKHFIKSYMSSFPHDPVFSLLDKDKDSHLQLQDAEYFNKLIQMLKDENYDEIIPLCTEAINSLEFNKMMYKMEILLLRATFYLLLGKHDMAIQDLDTIINSEETAECIKINALIKRATLNMQMENSETTFNDFDLAIKINPDYGDIYHHKGQVNLLLNNIQEAKSDFEKAVQCNPNFGVVYAQKCYADYRFAIFNRDMELLEVAMKDFEKAIEKFSDRPEGYMLYAQILSETQEYEKADMCFAEAIEKDPENANVYVHRGLLQLQWHGNDSNGIAKAVEYINKALELDEKCELGYETLGTIEVQRGNLKEAIRLFDKALELCRTSMELTHLYSLRDATKTQLTITNKLGLDIKAQQTSMAHHILDI